MLLDNVKSVAKEKKITLSEIEKECGFQRGAISHWNDNVPSVNRVKSVADFLGVDINILIDGDTEG